MKNVRTLTHGLLLAGATTVCLLIVHAAMYQPLVVLAKTPLTDTLQRVDSHSQSCQTIPSGTLFARTELFFGLSKPNGSQVSELDFQRFFDREVISRFPEGSTLLSGQGQFRNSKGVMVRESARVLILFYPFENKNIRNKSIEQIRDAYKLAFQQESVLRSDNLSCLSF